MKRKSEFREVPFVNTLGQVIRPGDEVYSKTTNYGISYRKCVFRGVNVVVIGNEEIISSISVINKNARVYHYDYKTRSGSYVIKDTISTLQKKRIVRVTNDDKTLLRYI